MKTGYLKSKMPIRKGNHKSKKKFRFAVGLKNLRKNLMILMKWKVSL